MDTQNAVEIDHLADLTDAQREAVEFRDGAALVVAGAGSGKTRVITRRIVHLLKSGVRSSRILALTFTNKAAGEMRERVEQMYPESKVYLGTFHSFASRILRRYWQKANLSKDFHICDDDDRRKILRECLTSCGVETTGEVTRAVSDEISRAKNTMLSAGRYAADARASYWLIGQVYQRYQWALRRSGYLDFDDLLNLLVKLLSQDEELRAKLDDQLRYVLVDEFQDTNLPQYAILRLLTRDVRNIMAVGDPDQTLYSWRGADIRNILGFKDDHPGCRMIKLEHNYRSTPQILSAADSVIRRNTERIEKVLIPTREAGERVQLDVFNVPQQEAASIASDIVLSVANGRQYSDHAILFRQDIDRMARPLEQSLIARDIPYQVVGGMTLLEKAEVKDVLAYCRLAANPGDLTAFARVVNSPSRGVGKASLDKLMARCEAYAEIPVVACRAAPRIEGVPRATAVRLVEFADVISEISQLLDRPADAIRAACEKTGYVRSLQEEETPEAGKRLANLTTLCEIADRFTVEQPQATMTDLLQRLTLGEEQDRAEGEDAPDTVKIMTVHASKGLEFPVVYMPGLEQGLLPSARSLTDGEPASIEEERRIFFVGITRAMDRLRLSYCHFRMNREGRMERNVPSMFLNELPRGEVATVLG